METGLIQVYTGNGKGKTTAAFGLALRALGRGMKVVIVQFFKTDTTGELLALQSFNLLSVVRVNSSSKFSWTMNEQETKQLSNEIHQGYLDICKLAESGSCDLLILDEINHAIFQNHISKSEVEQLFNLKSKSTELVLTGRNAPDWLIDMADLVTEMNCVKHPFNKGVPSRIGIEK